jgi:hypothetical protein
MDTYARLRGGEYPFIRLQSMYARHSYGGLSNVVFMSNREYDIAKVRLVTLRQ